MQARGLRPWPAQQSPGGVHRHHCLLPREAPSGRSIWNRPTPTPPGPLGAAPRQGDPARLGSSGRPATPQRPTPRLLQRKPVSSPLVSRRDSGHPHPRQTPRGEHSPNCPAGRARPRLPAGGAGVAVRQCGRAAPGPGGGAPAPCGLPPVPPGPHGPAPAGCPAPACPQTLP